jgi:ferredoxin
MNEMLVIDLSQCNGCGLCVEVCMCEKLFLADGVVQIRSKIECVECRQCVRWCTMCELVCPTGAIQCQFEVVAEE